ncbi:TRAP transporter small permease subunit [Aquamicrobium zhengzhouense]|uniref:TRAP transporter small permease protein n=1 Tax=Aquamicrobium zhengzhouense TaxID=2781738 RepID=A0ABS0SHL2_9HYPH|nr:TRAP transporter small permease subunit [Aquamicrobium zhengzhouense]MBI1622761.1 TRAP transporter small permease subunit [Aquamicrobium zhengzhouense]
MKFLSDMIGRLLETTGKVVSLSVLAIAAVVLIEILSRLFFRVSLPWAADVASWLMCVLIMLGGPWAVSTGKFVRVDALYAGFSPKVRLMIDTVVSSALLLFLAYVLIRYGYTFAERAFIAGERPASANWPAPIWAFKALIPVGAGLMVLGWARYLMTEWYAYLHPEEAASTPEEIQVHG